MASCGARPRHTSAAMCRSPGSSPPSLPTSSTVSSRTTWSSPASATSSRRGSAPSAPRSAQQRGRSTYPTCTPHQLRHTAASLAIAFGADVKVVQQMLGHSSASMTLDTYAHLFEDRLDEVATAMDAAREAAQQRRAGYARCPVLPSADLSRIVDAAPPTVSTGQDRSSDEYPRPDSKRRYRLESAASVQRIRAAERRFSQLRAGDLCTDSARTVDRSCWRPVRVATHSDTRFGPQAARASYAREPRDPRPRGVGLRGGGAVAVAPGGPGRS